MKKSLFVGITFMIMFTLSSIIQFASAQNAGHGYQGSSLEEQLQLAKKRVAITRDMPYADGIPATDPFFHHYLWDKHIAFFVYSIIIVSITGSCAFFVLFIKARKRSLRKTRNDIR